MRRTVPLTLLMLLCAGASAQAADPRVLVTGDSMMRGVDRSLRQELAAIQQLSFRSDVHIGEGITNAPWIRWARGQAREHRPHATVAFMGANDGYHMLHARCCRERWVAKYEDRVTRIIRAYLQGGRAEVYWLTLPASSMRSGRRRQIFPKINGAISRAVEASGPHAHLVDAWGVFTPGGRYRSTMLWNGAMLEVRSVDGVHLSRPGQGIAAAMIRDAMLADGVISRPVGP